MSDKNFKRLLEKDFDAIFSDMDLFISCIPRLASVPGVENFLKEMKMTKSKYYRRVDRNELWERSELEKAKEIFKTYKLGTKK
jgi:hypothetical protein